MAAKLKNIHLKKVDVVDEGANQHADIALIKNREGQEGIAEPEEPEEQQNNIFRKFARWLRGEGYTMEDVQKAATSFQTQMISRSVETIDTEIWDSTYALRNSFSSILLDEELDSASKATAMAESLSQFMAVMQENIPKWSTGTAAGVQKRAGIPGDAELAVIKKDYDFLGSMVAGKEKTEETKGEPEDMLKIDKSKMTPEERASYEDIIKKYAVEDGNGEPAGVSVSGAQAVPADGNTDDVAKSAASSDNDPAPADDAGTEILKGVIADLKKEIAGLKEANLSQELAVVAKKYEALGKKPEELIETLKKAKNAGMYDEVISAYDTALAAQEASGIFGEIGKSASGGDAGISAIAKAKAAAAELRKSNPDLTDAQALDQVLLADPELLKEFDQ